MSKLPTSGFIKGHAYSKNTSISQKVKEMHAFKEKIKKELKKHNYNNLELGQIELAVQEIREERNKEKGW